VYAQYRVLASENRLIQCLGVTPPAAAIPSQMARYHVNPIPPADLQENSIPTPALAAPPPAVAPAAAPAEPTDNMPPPPPPPAPEGR